MADTRPDRPAEIIDHGQVRLRRYREDDLDAVFQAVTDSLDHLRPWMPWAADYTRQAAAEFLAASAQGQRRGAAQARLHRGRAAPARYAAASGHGPGRGLAAGQVM